MISGTQTRKPNTNYYYLANLINRDVRFLTQGNKKDVLKASFQSPNVSPSCPVPNTHTYTYDVIRMNRKITMPTSLTLANDQT